VSKNARIGPEMPDVPVINAREPDPVVVDTPPAVETTREVKADGIIVETITTVQGARTETSRQVAARAKRTYTDTLGNTITEY
jgi:hypothetical protein